MSESQQPITPGHSPFCGCEACEYARSKSWSLGFTLQKRIAANGGKKSAQGARHHREECVCDICYPAPAAEEPKPPRGACGRCGELWKTHGYSCGDPMPVPSQPAKGDHAVNYAEGAAGAKELADEYRWLSREAQGGGK